MKRRNFVAGLLGLFGIGEAGKAATATAPKGEVLKMAVAELKSYHSPMLRVWSLGSLDHKLYPNNEAMERLAKILREWDGVSDLNVIWGPDLSVAQFNIGPGDVDTIVEPGQAKVENMGPGEGPNSIKARIVIDQPRITIIHLDENDPA